MRAASLMLLHPAGGDALLSFLSNYLFFFVSHPSPVCDTFFDETIDNEKYGMDYAKSVAFKDADAVKKKVTKYGKFSRMTVALPIRSSFGKCPPPLLFNIIEIEKDGQDTHTLCPVYKKVNMFVMHPVPLTFLVSK
jgi:hypothetical protein